MKKTYLAAALLALPLMFGGTVSAATLATYTHNYGSGAGQVDPGGDDVLSNGFVTVTDPASTGSNRFYDSFDFSGLSFSSISQFSLTLNYSGVGTYKEFLGIKTGEFWSVRPGGANVEAKFNLPSAGGLQTFTITSSTDTFSSMVSNKNFYFWFAEDTLGSDQFRLNSAALSITGAVPEPENYAMLLAGLGLMATIVRRRKGVQV